MDHMTWCDSRYFQDGVCNCAPRPKAPKPDLPIETPSRCLRCGMKHMMTLAKDGPAFACPSCGYTEEA